MPQFEISVLRKRAAPENRDSPDDQLEGRFPKEGKIRAGIVINSKHGEGSIDGEMDVRFAFG